MLVFSRCVSGVFGYWFGTIREDEVLLGRGRTGCTTHRVSCLALFAVAFWGGGLERTGRQPGTTGLGSNRTMQE
jgi:hypothetical protein